MPDDGDAAADQDSAEKTLLGHLTNYEEEAYTILGSYFKDKELNCLNMGQTDNSGCNLCFVNFDSNEKYNEFILKLKYFLKEKKFEPKDSTINNLFKKQFEIIYFERKEIPNWRKDALVYDISLTNMTFTQIIVYNYAHNCYFINTNGHINISGILKDYCITKINTNILNNLVDKKINYDSENKLKELLDKYNNKIINNLNNDYINELGDYDINIKNFILNNINSNDVSIENYTNIFNDLINNKKLEQKFKLPIYNRKSCLNEKNKSSRSKSNQINRADGRAGARLYHHLALRQHARLL
jgi:hypothetical protein